MSNLLLIGGGGHCLTVVDSLRRDDYDKIGIVDASELVGKLLCDTPFVGCDDDLEILREEYCLAFISLGSVGNWQKRKDLARKLINLQYKFAKIIHPKAVVSEYAHISNGVLVAPSSVVNACADIGEMCIINSGSIAEHNCKIEAYAHIAPGAVLCGGVRVGTGSHIGAGSVVKEGVSIGENVIIGIGSVVTRDIPDNVIAYGNPCKILKNRRA